MNDMRLRVVMRLVRTWTRLYTTGVPADVRERRRAEIESDLWESRHQQQRSALAAQILLRLVLGVPDDLVWRSSNRTRLTLVRAAVTCLIAAGVLASGLLLAMGRGAALPQPPPLTPHTRALPPPPPPPPPPCAPPGSGRRSPSPCSR